MPPIWSSVLEHSSTDIFVWRKTWSSRAWIRRRRLVKADWWSGRTSWECQKFCNGALFQIGKHQTRRPYQGEIGIEVQRQSLISAIFGAGKNGVLNVWSIVLMFLCAINYLEVLGDFLKIVSLMFCEIRLEFAIINIIFKLTTLLHLHNLFLQEITVRSKTSSKTTHRIQNFQLATNLCRTRKISQNCTL